MPQDYLTIRQAAAYLRLSRWTIGRRIADGTFTATQAAQEKRIPMADIAAYERGLRNRAARCSCETERHPTPGPAELAERLYTLQEAADEAGLSLSAVEKAVRSGRVAHQRGLDRRYRFTPAQVVALKYFGTFEPPPPVPGTDSPQGRAALAAQMFERRRRRSRATQAA